MKQYFSISCFVGYGDLDSLKWPINDELIFMVAVQCQEHLWTQQGHLRLPLFHGSLMTFGCILWALPLELWEGFFFVDCCNPTINIPLPLPHQIENSQAQTREAWIPQTLLNWNLYRLCCWNNMSLLPWDFEERKFRKEWDDEFEAKNLNGGVQGLITCWSWLSIWVLHVIQINYWHNHLLNRLHRVYMWDCFHGLQIEGTVAINVSFSWWLICEAFW